MRYTGLLGLTAILLVIAPYSLLAKPATTSNPEDRAGVVKMLDRLKVIRRDLQTKITICNSGKILTRACPVPAEPTGAGSLVKALQQTNQTIATLELYLRSTPKSNRQ
jgi:hypothetical protein